MPVILPEQYHQAWLSAEAGKAWAISPRVNSPRNNYAELIEPVGVETD
jgi:putative SOS response-associated peptidase YedK